MIRIIYHSADFDGHCSGAIARRYFDTVNKQDYTLHPYNHGQDFPHEEMEEGDTLYFLDVVYKPLEDVYKWEEIFGYKIYVCDHHKNVIESDLEEYISGGILNKDYSGCELTWIHFFPDTVMPRIVELLGRYDVWDQSSKSRWEHMIVPFQMGFNLFNTNPINERSYQNVWERIFNFNGYELNEFIDDVVYKGKIINKYQKNMNYRDAKSYAEELEFEGYRALVINSTNSSSMLLDSIWDEELHDIKLIYRKSKHGYGVSVTTTKDIDLTQVVKKFGGGGHKQASGFGADEVRFYDGKIDFIVKKC